ncbi:MAG: AMP phosphorylase [Candidatus Gracilibacteria bacterium]
MKLNATKIPIRVGNKYIAILNEKRAHFLDLQASDRVILKKRGKPSLRALLDITENSEIKENEIGLYEETWDKLGITNYGEDVYIEIAEKPISTTYIKKKLNGERLSAAEINEIIKDVVEEDLTDIEMAYFVSGCYVYGLDDKETANLTKSIVKNGQQLKFGKKIIADKHCIGGVPGNRTTMVVVPIVTAAGVMMPKTSSRAITSPAGTADTMEALANVTIQAPKLLKIAKHIGGFITWGGGVDLAAADDKMIRARQPLSLDPQGMLLASIMAKKFSVSANHVLIDIPVGPQVKIKTKKEARELKRRFIKLGRMLGMKVKVIFTDGDQPIGNGIGPALEAIDVLKVLQNDPTAPRELREKSLMMAGILLELCGKAKWSRGKTMARKILDSGKAYNQMMRIIKAQGANRIKPRPGKFSKIIRAGKTGRIVEINCKLISHIARTAGAPKDPEAGLYLHKHLGDKIQKGEPLYTIYADIEERLEYTKQYPLNKAFVIK